MFWEDSPDGWPQRWSSKGGQFRLDGRPTAQWSRIQPAATTTSAQWSAVAPKPSRCRIGAGVFVAG
jgi:hypothetical protein